eukprot:gnl/MRDRNA2_/MRDRNA2_34812_c0_seq1.p1 gnl/MRDRNA2_/MRDRNA2_34812_c0~~gnl/MRDRNA2_/MRDRNA2_34812_c0_seq1.p1  ORF type:complete len:500 (-),score=79.66 gnl/MRDRNA2_/MRDRNA2_34812_c0_seq1:730-2229(-)
MKVGANDVETGKHDAPRPPAGLVSSIKGIFVGVPGPRWQKVVYFICQACAVTSFIATCVSIIRAAAEESITRVEVKLVDTVPMPGMFGCAPASSGTPEFEPFTQLDSCPHDAMATIFRHVWGVGMSQECFRLVSTVSNSGGSLTLLTPGATTKEKEFLGYLTRHFQHTSGITEWGCFISNADGKLMNSRSSPVSVDIAYRGHITNETDPVFPTMGYLGLFDASLTGDFNEIFQSNSQIYQANIINGMNVLKFTYDKTVDHRGGYLAVLSDGRSTDGKAKVTNVFAGSLSSTPVHFYKRMSDAKTPYLWFTFEVSSFVSREITLRNKYLSEMWTEIGGAWASALLITSFFFLEKVGGIKGKIKVFRFNTDAAQKALMNAATKEFGEMLQQQVGEELHGIVGKANMDEAMKIAERAKQAEDVAPTLVALRSVANAEGNTNVPMVENTPLDDQMKKLLDELWAVEREKLLMRMKVQLQAPVAQQVDASPPIPGQPYSPQART